jgi:flagellar motor component MotA
MSTAGSRVLIGTLVAAGLAHPVADALRSSQGDRHATFISRVETLQKMLEGKSVPEAGTEVAQFRDLPWTNFSQWAQCGSDVKC